MMRKCKGCGVDKPSSSFPLRGRRTNRRNTKLSPYCRDCMAAHHAARRRQDVTHA